MATIRFKRGTTDPVVGIGPTGLTAGEPAFNSTDKKFFIHDGTTAIWVGAEIENSNDNWSDETVIPTKNAVNDLVSTTLSGGANVVNSVNGATGDVLISESGPGLFVQTTAKSITITNTGVTSIVAGTGLSGSGTTGAVTLENIGVQSLTLSAATNKGLSISTAGPPGAGTTGALTKSISLDFANAASLVGVTAADKFFIGDASNSDSISYTTIGTVLDFISGDVNVDANGTSSIGSGVIVDADISGSAAISDTKLAKISTANKIDIDALDIDGGDDINAALADADLIIVDDGAGGTNRKSAMSRVPTYVFSKVSGDITIASNGTAAIGSGVIVDADISGSANIAVSKLAASTISGVALGNNLNALTIGSGLGGAASYNGSSAVTITNEGVRSLTGTTNEITVSGSTGDITIGLPDDVTIGGNLSIVGNLTVNGTTTTVNSTTVQIQDPIFTLGGTAALGSDDNKDRGIEFRWHNGSTAKTGFFGYDDSIGRFTFIPDATNSSEVFSGTVGDVQVASVYLASNGNLGQIVPIGTLSGARTYTLPDVSGTIITTGDTATVTNTMLATITTANKVELGAIDLDGATETTTIAGTDLLFVDDGANGTNRKVTVNNLFASNSTGIIDGGSY
jgi:hypothetical protein